MYEKQMMHLPSNTRTRIPGFMPFRMRPHMMGSAHSSAPSTLHTSLAPTAHRPAHPTVHAGTARPWWHSCLGAMHHSYCTQSSLCSHRTEHNIIYLNVYHLIKSILILECSCLRSNLHANTDIARYGRVNSRRERRGNEGDRGIGRREGGWNGRGEGREIIL